MGDHERDPGDPPRHAVISSPLIGVSTSITIGTSPERAYVNSSYLHAVQQAGGVPVVVLPPQLSVGLAWRRLDVEGWTGFSSRAAATSTPPSSARPPHSDAVRRRALPDTLESSARSASRSSASLPVLAICRGVQGA